MTPGRRPALRPGQGSEHRWHGRHRDHRQLPRVPIPGRDQHVAHALCGLHPTSERRFITGPGRRRGHAVRCHGQDRDGSAGGFDVLVDDPNANAGTALSLYITGSGVVGYYSAGSTSNYPQFHFTSTNVSPSVSSYTAVVGLGGSNAVAVNSSGVVTAPTGTGGMIVSNPNDGTTLKSATPTCRPVNPHGPGDRLRRHCGHQDRRELRSV